MNHRGLRMKQMGNLRHHFLFGMTVPDFAWQDEVWSRTVAELVVMVSVWHPSAAKALSCQRSCSLGSSRANEAQVRTKMSSATANQTRR